MDSLCSSIESKIIELASKEVSWSCIGKNTDTIKYQRVTLLNMWRMFDGCLDDGQLSILDCYYVKHFGAKKKVAIRAGATPVNPEISSPISISTSGAVTITTSWWGASLVRDFERGAYPSQSWVDIIDPDFEALVADLNFQMLFYSGGAVVHYDQVIIGNTALSGSNPNVQGNGYNCLSSGCAVIDGVCCGVFGHDGFNNNVQLCKDLGVIMNLTSNVHLGSFSDLTTWQNQILWKMLHCANQGVTVKVVWLGMEEANNDQDSVWQGDGTVTFPLYNSTQLAHGAGGLNYVTKVDQGVAAIKAQLPSVQVGVIIGSIISVSNGNVRFSGWNDNVRATMATGHYNSGSEYFNPQQLNMPLGSNFSVNLQVVLDTAWNQMPSYLDLVRTQNPGKSISVTQWGLSSFTEDLTPIHNTLLGLLYLTWMGCMFITYHKTNNCFNAVTYQTLKSLIDSTPVFAVRPHYYALQKLGMIFSTNPAIATITIPSTDTDIYGLSWKDTATSDVWFLLTNQGATYKIYDSVAVNGTSTSTVVRYSVYGDSLSGTTFTLDEGISEDVINVLPFSINVYKIT